MYRKEVHYKNPLREFTLKSIPPFLAYDFGDSLKIHRENYFQAFIDSFDVEKPLEIVDVSKKPSYESSLENEILSIEDMDFGKFKSLVVKDPFNKKNIRGFVYMPVSVWGAELTPLARPVIGLAEALKKYTNIESKLDVRILLSSSEVFKFPFLYIITEEAFELNPEERKNFTEYLMYGGFAVLDNGFPQDTHSGAEASLRKMLWDAKTDIGSSAFITIIPLGHPLYHCFFDFFDGPPLGAALIPPEEFASNKQVIDKEYHPVPCLEGLWIDNRLSAIYSDMGYGLRWTQIANNIPQQKIGINMVVYALTRFGGVTYNELTAVSSIR